MRLAESVAAGDQRHRLFVVHRHARKGLANIARRGHRVGVAVGAFRVHVDQAHLHGGQRICQFAVAAVALVATAMWSRDPNRCRSPAPRCPRGRRRNRRS